MPKPLIFILCYLAVMPLGFIGSVILGRYSKWHPTFKRDLVESIISLLIVLEIPKIILAIVLHSNYYVFISVLFDLGFMLFMYASLSKNKAFEEYFNKVTFVFGLFYLLVPILLSDYLLRFNISVLTLYSLIYLVIGTYSLTLLHSGLIGVKRK